MTLRNENEDTLDKCLLIEIVCVCVCVCVHLCVYKTFLIMEVDINKICFT